MQLYGANLWSPTTQSAHAAFLVRFENYMRVVPDGTPESFLQSVSSKVFSSFYRPGINRRSYPSRRSTISKFKDKQPSSSTGMSVLDPVDKEPTSGNPPITVGGLSMLLC